MDPLSNPLLTYFLSKTPRMVLCLCCLQSSSCTVPEWGMWWNQLSTRVRLGWVVCLININAMQPLVRNSGYLNPPGTSEAVQQAVTLRVQSSGTSVRVNDHGHVVGSPVPHWPLQTRIVESLLSDSRNLVLVCLAHFPNTSAGRVQKVKPDSCDRRWFRLL